MSDTELWEQAGKEIFWYEAPSIVLDDSDPPLGGLAPESQNALFHRALAEGLTPEAFNEALAARDTQRLP